MECDPSIKSIILKIDADDHAFIVEELDDQTLVVKETMVNLLKQKLQEVDITEANMAARLTRDCSTSRKRSKSHSFLDLSREVWELADAPFHTTQSNSLCPRTYAPTHHGLIIHHLGSLPHPMCDARLRTRRSTAFSSALDGSQISL